VTVPNKAPVPKQGSRDEKPRPVSAVDRVIRVSETLGMWALVLTTPGIAFCLAGLLLTISTPPLMLADTYTFISVCYSIGLFFFLLSGGFMFVAGVVAGVAAVLNRYFEE
jgi:hypothetical protein